MQLRTNPGYAPLHTVYDNTYINLPQASKDVSDCARVYVSVLAHAYVCVK